MSTFHARNKKMIRKSVMLSMMMLLIKAILMVRTGWAIIKDRSKGPRVAKEHKPESENWMGKIEPGDPIIDVIKLEPICPNSKTFEYPDKTRHGMTKHLYDQKHFAVFVEDVRLVGIEMEMKDKPRPKRLASIVDDFLGQYCYWELAHEDRERILECMPKYDDGKSAKKAH